MYLAYDATPEDLHNLLFENYPQLRSCGGYSLFKCSGPSKQLEMIEPPLGGHCPLSLSDVGQSRIYVRPLQQDIPLRSYRSGGEVSLCHVNGLGAFHLFIFRSKKSVLNVTTCLA